MIKETINDEVSQGEMLSFLCGTRYTSANEVNSALDEEFGSRVYSDDALDVLYARYLHLLEEM